MKPAPFRWHAPRHTDEVLALLAEHGDEARVLAGGQTLGPMLNMRVVTPGVLVDINRVEGLAGIRWEGDGGGVRIGATTRQAALEDDPVVGAAYPLLRAALPWIAHRPIRNRGTVGGSLAHADPAAEWGALALVHDAVVHARGAGGGARTFPAEDFFEGLLTTALEPGELLTAIHLPPWDARWGWSFRELARRRGDFALAGVACRVALDGGGRVEEARIALFGVDDRPLRAREAEALVVGAVPGEGSDPGGRALAREAGETAARLVEPMEDHHASGEYRRHLVRVLLEDALAEAWGRGEGGDT